MIMEDVQYPGYRSETILKANSKIHTESHSDRIQ